MRNSKGPSNICLPTALRADREAHAESAIEGCLGQEYVRSGRELLVERAIQRVKGCLALFSTLFPLGSGEDESKNAQRKGGWGHECKAVRLFNEGREKIVQADALPNMDQPWDKEKKKRK